MNTEQKHQQQRIEFQERIIGSQNWTTCLNCVYWDKKEELCTTFSTRPPLTVVVVGCPEWLGDIPF